jgi:hypothetical protein
LFQFGRIIRDYPPSPAEDLTSNERAIAVFSPSGAERASDEADHNEFNRRSSTGNGSSLDTAGAVDYG